MSIHKDNATGKWRVVYRYTDWTGETHQSYKRGFPTKREAQMWERELLLKKEAKLDMTFESFYEIYVEDMQNRIRDNTWGTKTNTGICLRNRISGILQKVEQMERVLKPEK